MSEPDLAHAAIALTLLLVAAHGGRRLFVALRQPPVIGEIFGGLLLGPTVLGLLLPDVRAALLPTSGPIAVVIQVTAYLGLLLLMFVAGVEARSLFSSGDRRLVMLIVAVGTVVPTLMAVLFLVVVDVDRFAGPAASKPALALVVVCAFTVISVPVISRIMLDLGLLNTRFARVVLSVAVLEDLLTYVALAVALSLAGASTGTAPPLLKDAHLPVGWLIAYHVVVVLLFAFLVLGVAYGMMRRRGAGGSVSRKSVNGVAGQLVLILAVVGVSSLAGVPAMFGAFVVGCTVALAGETGAAAERTIRGFGVAFFIPVYFAFIGLKLNLVTDLVILFTVGFIVAACVAKTLGVYVGSRVAGEPPARAVSFAAAMNARGGPGIVLASTAFAAGIINQELFTTLIMLAIVTSFMAASWLRFRMPESPAPEDRPPVDTSASSPPSLARG